MRKIVAFIAALASFSFIGCSTHSAYGPDSDARLEEGMSPTSKESADASKLLAMNCDEHAKRLSGLSVESDETKKLKGLGVIYLSAKDTYEKLDAAASSHTDLLYGKEGDKIKGNLATCRDTASTAYIAFDRFVRELVDMPVVQEMKNRKMVNVARVDFKLLREAITKLDATDKELLNNRITAMESSIQKSE